MELTDVFAARRSHRSFKDTPVSRTALTEILQAGRTAPSSCNLQLTQFVVVDDKAILADLAKRVSYKFAYAPACIVVLYDPRFTVEHHSSVMTAGMEVENMILKATDLGLATCPMAGFKKDSIIKRALSIPDPLELLLLLAVGHPAQDKLFPIPKIPDEEVFSFNSYSGLRSMNGSIALKNHSVKDVVEYRSRIAPVYLERFRLRVFDDSYYEAALKVFRERVLTPATVSVLDLVSYDGMFLKLLREKEPSLALTASDYVANNLALFAKELGTESVLITDENRLKAAEAYDAVSFVFQGEFTPSAGSLLAEAAAHVRTGGRIFVATVRDSWYRRFRDMARRLFRYLARLPINVYEGNPFYRTGPRGSFSRGGQERALASSCRLLDSGVAASFPLKGTRVEFSVYEKLA